ncbi:MAG TPA: type II secretion system F family protein [Lacipirellula sp.]
MFSPRIRLKPLAQLCRRLATATRAGLEDRRIWQSESERGGRAQREAVATVSDALSRGDSVGDALARTGDYFPVMFRQIVALGDATGTLDRVYRRLAEHYEHMLAARRTMMSALAWPMIQLGIAAGVIGVVIWISSALGLKNIDGEPLDMFGLGLTGSRGLTIYVTILTFFAIAVLLFIEASRRGVLWTRSLQRAALRVPAIGGALQTLALARFTWALQLILDTSMDLRKALPLALDATGNDYYKRLAARVAQNIGRGMTLHLALAETGAFPRDLLDAIAVGEQSGMLQETMERQAKEYQERSAAAISILAQFFGYIVWALVAALIVMLIFRVFGSYVGTIERMSQPGFR